MSQYLKLAYRVALGSSLALCLWACDGAKLQNPDMPPAADLSSSLPATLKATVTCNPNMVVGGLVSITTAGADEVSVEFGDSAAYGRATPHRPVDKSNMGPTVIPIFGLTPDTMQHVRVTSYAGGNPVAVSPDLTVKCDPLPPGSAFPQCSVNMDNGGTANYVLVSAAEPTHVMAPQFGYGFIVDRTGRPIWYHKIRSINYDRRSYDFARKAPGLFTIFQTDTLAFEEVNLVGEDQPTRWVDKKAALGADGHAIAFFKNGNAALIGVDHHMEDTSRFMGGGPNTNVLDGTLDVVDAMQNNVFHWSSTPAITLDEVPAANPYAILVWDGSVDAPHPNGLSLIDDTHALLGFYWTNTLLNIDLTTGKIVWRLGGMKSDFTFVDAQGAVDPMGPFDHQHDAHFLPNGNLLVFDNALLEPGTHSRVVEYKLDLAKKTATRVWAYVLPVGNSPAGGSATRLSNGHTVIGWPLAHLIDEVDENGKLLWELDCSWPGLYRAVPLPLEVKSIYE